MLHQPPLVVVQKQAGGSDVVGVPLTCRHQPSPFIDEAGCVIFEAIFLGRGLLAAENVNGKLLGDLAGFQPRCFFG